MCQDSNSGHQEPEMELMTTHPGVQVPHPVNTKPASELTHTPQWDLNALTGLTNRMDLRIKKSFFCALALPEIYWVAGHSQRQLGKRKIPPHFRQRAMLSGIPNLSPKSFQSPHGTAPNLNENNVMRMAEQWDENEDLGWGRGRGEGEPKQRD